MAALSLTEPRFAVLPGGARISYLEAGTENDALPPLVLLHGMGSAARSWRDQLAGLSRDRRVVAWDAPGYGESTPLVPEQIGRAHVELQSLMRTSYAVFCLKKKTTYTFNSYKKQTKQRS